MSEVILLFGALAFMGWSFYSLGYYCGERDEWWRNHPETEDSP